MKRHRDDAEERDELPPLFALAEQRAQLGMTRAADKAERIQRGWREDALEAVRVFASTHSEPFLAEQIRASMSFSSEIDPRAFGLVMREAAKLGYVKADGYAPTHSSNGSPKVRWRSLLRQGMNA